MCTFGNYEIHTVIPVLIKCTPSKMLKLKIHVMYVSPYQTDSPKYFYLFDCFD